MIISIVGYHGTSADAAESIVEEGYLPSIGDREWLGDGVYFFIKGLLEPINLAKKWAEANAWDNEKKLHRYKEYCILKSIIKVCEDNFLDLTTEDGVKVFQYLVEKLKNKVNTSGRKLLYLDGLIINMARRKNIVPIDVVKGNFYIKFAEERKSRINFRTNNSTVCVVYDSGKNIVLTEIIQR